MFLYLCEEKNKLEIPLSATEVALFLHPRKKALLMGEEYGGLVFNLQLLITIARENMLVSIWTICAILIILIILFYD